MRLPVAFFLHNLNGGGAESVALTWLKDLSREQFDLSLVLLEPEGKLLPHVPGDVPLYLLPRPRDWRGNPYLYFLERVLSLGRLLQRLAPRLVVAHLPYPQAILLTLQRLSPWRSWKGLHWLHGFPEITGPPGEHRALRRLFPAADLLIAVSSCAAAAHRRHYGLPAGRVQVLANPHSLESIRARAGGSVPSWPGSGVRLLASGRLDPIKGFDLLLRSLARLTDLDWSLVVLGEGPLASSLTELSHSLGLEGRVHFPGFQDEPFPWLGQAQVFISSSRSEASPGVVIEAMAVGLAIVACDCPGNREVLGEGRFGLLAPPHEEGLAGSLRRMLESPQERTCWSERSRAGALPFSAPQAISRGADLLLRQGGRC
jgi:glycosyltransferase involved in cell wall biosynthesis